MWTIAGGGIHPVDEKELTATLPIEDIMPPENRFIGKICGTLRRKTNKGTYEIM